MIHDVYEEQGNVVTELDGDAIDYYIQGLEQLRDMEPGEELATPSADMDENGMPQGMGWFILRRAADEDYE